MRNNAMVEGRVDDSGKIIVEVKQKPDLIEKSLALRIAQPGKSYSTVVPNKEKKEKEELVFKLRFKGAIPKLNSAPKDPTLGFMDDAIFE